jgi:hypothetical protein
MAKPKGTAAPARSDFPVTTPPAPAPVADDEIPF